jgi:RimJ/RimL family protein N-acetyltransferase
MIRHEYLVTQAGYRPSGRTVPEGFEVRPPTHDDRIALADLMMSAYVDTIDYDGETHEQAVEEVDGAFADEALLEESRVAIRDGTIHSAVLVSLVDSDAFIGYVMTRADDKNTGLASALLDESIAAIWAAGYDRVRCFITEGNRPSERVFYRAGFRVIGTIGKPETQRVNPLEALRAKWPEQVAQLEDVIASDFLRSRGGGAAVSEVDGMLEIEVYDEASAEEAHRRWPDARVAVVPLPIAEPKMTPRESQD